MRALPDSRADFQARLQDDALLIGNQVILLPQQRQPVRTQIEISDACLREMTERALEAGAKPDSRLLPVDSFLF